MLEAMASVSKANATILGDEDQHNENDNAKSKQNTYESTNDELMSTRNNASKHQNN